MKPSQELFILIRSLSSYEVAYVRKYFVRESGREKVQYLALFEAILAQSTYDETAVRAEFEDQSKGNWFAVAKHYLFHRILDALDQYHAKQGEFGAAFRLLRKVEVLFNRGLYDLCNKMLRKAEMEFKEGPQTLNLLALEWRKRLNKVQIPIRKAEMTDTAIQEKELAIIADLTLNNEFWWLHSQAFSQFVFPEKENPAKNTAYFQNLLAAPQIQQVDLARTFEAKVHRLETLILCYHKLTRTQEMYASAEALVHLLEANPQRFRWETFRYFNALVLLINAAINDRAFPAALELLQKGQVACRNGRGMAGHQRVMIHRALFHFEMRTLVGLGLYARAIERAGNLKKSYAKYAERFSHRNAVMLHPNLAWAYLGHGQPQKALYWLQKALMVPHSQASQGSMIKARMMELVTHYDLENFELLDSLSESLRKFLHNHGATNFFLSKFCRMFHSLGFAAGEQARVEILKEYLALFKEEHKKRPTEFSGIYYFDTLFWMEGHIQGKPMAEIVPLNYPATDNALVAEILKQAWALDE